MPSAALRGTRIVPVRSCALVLVLLLLATPATASHPLTDSGRTVSFDHKTGNEWWVELLLSGADAASVSKVESMDTGGPWVSLDKKEWGAWAASFRIEPGHQVRFRATWTGGATVTSCWFSHPSGVEDCSMPPPSGFDATFTLVKGNEWWVQTQATPNTGHAVRAVDVRLDAGEWRPLAKQSWGVNEWAASYRIVDGTQVQFRATSGSGATDLSGCYRWIPPPGGGQDAAPVDCAGNPGAFDASFTEVKGNDWWVQAKVRANQPLAGVDARVGCAGSWKPLTLRDWGSWAASFHIPSGSVLDLRARSASGASDVSSGFVWPQATPTSACGAWPVEGSHADIRFRAEERWSDVDGSHLVRTDGLLHVEWHGDAWSGICEVRRDHQSAAGWDNRTETWPWQRGPPRGELPATVGGRADVETVENCATVLYPDVPVTERRTRTFSLRTSSGDPVTVTAYHGVSSGPTHAYDFWWDHRHGLMLSWTLDQPGSNSHHASGWLLSTDAPMG